MVRLPGASLFKKATTFIVVAFFVLVDAVVDFGDALAVTSDEDDCGYEAEQHGSHYDGSLRYDLAEQPRGYLSHERTQH